MRIVKYTEKYKPLWEEFLLNSKNGTFILSRNYMDYHKDRFDDYSLLIFDDSDRVCALLPANIDNNQLISHEGLTYGGLIYDKKVSQVSMLCIFRVILEYLLKKNITSLFYKTIPTIYHTLPAGEDLYVLFLLDSVLVRRDCLTVIDTSSRIEMQGRRKRSLNKSLKYDFTVKESSDYQAYWLLLENNLKDRYGVSPVHSVNEISLLVRDNPENIKLFGCFRQNEMIAGIVVYETIRVAHFQYIAVSSAGRDIGALDYLVKSLIDDIFSTKKFIDFGISNEKQGRLLNKGLLEYKVGFGGRTIPHDYYKISIEPKALSNIDRALI